MLITKYLTERDYNFLVDVGQLTIQIDWGQKLLIILRNAISYLV